MDPRIANQQTYLSGVSLMRRSWSAPVQATDHERCCFCGATFIAPGIRGAIEAGYATVDSRHWICDDCFLDFKDVFDWSVI